MVPTGISILIVAMNVVESKPNYKFIALVCIMPTAVSYIFLYTNYWTYSAFKFCEAPTSVMIPQKFSSMYREGELIYAKRSFSLHCAFIFASSPIQGAINCAADRFLCSNRRICACRVNIDRKVVRNNSGLGSALPLLSSASFELYSTRSRFITSSVPNFSFPSYSIIY